MFGFRNSSKKHLPFPNGKHQVSCVDVMTEYSKDGVFFRIFYPASTDKKIQDEPESWFPWSPHDMYIKGIASFVNLWAFIIRLLVFLYGGTTYVPAFWEEEPIKDCKMPIVIFSHGFGASRFICSTICSDLASQGYFVAAVEHRDTSACATYYYKSEEDRDNNVRTWVRHNKLNCGPNHYTIRNKQVKFRTEEVIKVMNFLEEIQDGTAEKIVIPTKFDVLKFKNCLDLSKVALMGHSFGGATSLLALSMDSRFKLGIILDAWMFPLKDEKTLKIRQPLLFINSATFHIPSNITAIEAVMAQPNGAKREIYTIKHSTHETQTDSPFILGYWLDWFKHKVDPKLGTEINNFLIQRFLSAHTGVPQNLNTNLDAQDNIYPKYIMEGAVVGADKPRRQFLS
uniref:1-alkyl-2-acetylglycerophosphocholine esterase n=1 Tax=Clastoptera arizonana TaxID=38151 RepID=A0A1B6DX37_9HEMI